MREVDGSGRKKRKVRWKDGRGRAGRASVKEKEGFCKEGSSGHLPTMPGSQIA